MLETDIEVIATDLSHDYVGVFHGCLTGRAAYVDARA